MPYRRRHDTQDFTPTESTELRAQILEARAAAGALGTWVLESKLGEDGEVQRTPLNPLPFRIGRAAGLQMVLPSNHVSKAHAEIYSDGLTLRIRDLGSRNGTLLIRESVREARFTTATSFTSATSSSGSRASSSSRTAPTPRAP